MAAESGFLATPDHERIAFTHYKGGHSYLVVIVHGFYNSKDSLLLVDLAEELSASYDVFMFDLRGHGTSSGRFSWSSREVGDCGVVAEYLGHAYEKTGVIAFSLGASIIINALAAQLFADSLVCVGAVADFAKIDYHFWEMSLMGDFVYTLLSKKGRIGKGIRPGPFWLEKTKPADVVSRIPIPVLYLHGEKDWVIKPWHSRALFEKTPGRKKMVVIRRGPHAEYLLRDNREEFLEEVTAWLHNTL